MIKISDIEPELKFRTSRSGGPGGQHLNKVNTKVTLIWNIKGSEVLNDIEKQRLSLKMKSKINSDGDLVLSSQRYRSQIRNKQDVQKKLMQLIFNAFRIRKKRMPTKPTASSIEKRLKQKKHQGQKKKDRRGF